MNESCGPRPTRFCIKDRSQPFRVDECFTNLDKVFRYNHLASYFVKLIQMFIYAIFSLLVKEWINDERFVDGWMAG